MTSSHAPRQKPTLSLALVALAIVHRYRPDWCGTTLKSAAATANVRPEVLSHLVTRALGPFEAILARLTRRGRPPAETGGQRPEQELGITRALLEVASSVLKTVAPRQRGRCRDLIVGAWDRLRVEYPNLTQAAFAAAVGVPERTLRSWFKGPRVQEPRPAPEPKAPSPAPSKKLRRPRFRFDLVLPGVQFGADTTGLAAFDTDLKMVGVQDIGGRDRSLFDSVVLDTSESSAHVVAAMKEAAEGLAGAQMLTDQGSPYMAEATKQALEALEVEHAPQKEGDPTGKSTVERGFKTLKSIAAPILNLTSELARAIPILRNESLAKASASLLMTALLRAYQAGGRAARRASTRLGQLSEAQLLAVAERAREAARATERSRRLFLTHVHQLYALPGSVKDFVRRFRRYPIEVLCEAERAFRRAILRKHPRAGAVLRGDRLQPLRRVQSSAGTGAALGPNAREPVDRPCARRA